MTRTLGAAFLLFFGLVAFSPAGLRAQQQPARRPAAAKPAAKPATPAVGAPSGTAMLLTATSANVAQPGVPVRIQILRWSTDQERTPVIEAFTAPPPAPARQGGAPGREGAAGRAGAAGAARGGGAAAPAARGRGRGAAPAAPQTPEDRLEAALMKAPTVGYIWTSDVTGYSIKYAYRVPSAAGAERIILISDRRLGEYNPAWKLKGTATSPDYDFTLVEIRTEGKTEQGKTTLTNKIAVDNEAKTLALDDFASAPALLQNVKHQAGS